MKMENLIAFNYFKDFYSAKKVSKLLLKGLKQKATIVPVADGGDGTIEAIKESVKCKTIRKKVISPLYSKKVTASYIITKDNIAIIEMNSSSGLKLLKEEHRNPLKTTTYGFGQLIRDAIKRDVKKIIMCLGGSATVDCGIGALTAIGFKFYDEDDNWIEYPRGVDVGRVKSYDTPEHVFECEFEIASDVETKLNDVHIYTNQKISNKLDKKEIRMKLAEEFDKFKKVINMEKKESKKGTGAAGGLGFGLYAFLDAKIKPGFQVVSDLINFEDKVKNHNTIITGEGGFDDQTFHGKAPYEVACLAKKHKKKCILVAGHIGKYDKRKAKKYFDQIIDSSNGKIITYDDIKKLGKRNIINAGKKINN